MSTYTSSLPDIILDHVNLGSETITIPVAKFPSDVKGKTILITGGMDGDEYSGIKAAYELINWYRNHKVIGKLVIIPIVNIPGFFACTSLNPQDRKYPKYTYPGKSNGSSTERLIYWLATKYVSSVDIWIDLHCGSISEKLTPFVWTWETSNKTVNKATLNLLSNISARIKIFQKNHHSSRIEKLAQNNCLYITLESGQLGKYHGSSISNLTTWVKQIIQTANSPYLTVRKQHTYYTDINFYKAKYTGLWKPRFNFKPVKKDMILGILSKLNGEIQQEIKVKEGGQLLWGKSALFCNRGDDLAAVATLKSLKNNIQDR